MAEFKKLSNVEKIETVADDATVLIEEGGVIKRAPKSEVGGGTASSLAYDAVIDLGVYSDTNSLSDLAGGSVPVGTVKMITEKVNAGEMPKLMGKIAYSYYDVLNHGTFEFTAAGTYGANQVKCYCDVWTYSGHYSLIVYLRDDGEIGTDHISSVEKL